MKAANTLLVQRARGTGDQVGISRSRLKSIEEKVGLEFKSIGNHFLEPEALFKNIENFVGATQVPLGVAGPVKINGEHAKGLHYVPFATTEGTLVDGYTLGMIAVSRSGGANVKVLSHKIDITPLFELPDIFEASSFSDWLIRSFEQIKDWCAAKTRHSKLLEIKPLLIGRRVFVHFVFSTQDAMGLNTISIATDHACQEILKHCPNIQKFYLRSNLSADKKAAYSNFLNVYGKEVVAECTIKREILEKYLRTTADKMCDFWHASVLSGFQAGTVGHNAHYANALAAIYIACGQDVAQIVSASMGISSCEALPNGDVYSCLRLPCLVLGTVGGGTSLPTQRESLELMGCYGDGKSDKFAEIVAATLLAGEVSICAALSSGEFIKAHIRKRVK